MPAATALARIARFDFCAILAPGFCLVAVASLLVTAWLTRPLEDQNSKSVHVDAQLLRLEKRPADLAPPTFADEPRGKAADAALLYLSNHVRANWPLAVALVVLAYMLGSILRAISPSGPDRCCGFFFTAPLRMVRFVAGFSNKHRGNRALSEQERARRRSFTALMYADDFPYLPVLEEELALLRRCGMHFLLPSPEAAHTLFNNWKLSLCHVSPPAFDLAQEREARVRLFSGTILAALICGLLGGVGVLLCRRGCIDVSWLVIMSSITVVSLLFAFLHGWRLRHVRVAEVLAVFHGAVALSNTTRNDLADPAPH